MVWYAPKVRGFLTYHRRCSALSFLPSTTSRVEPLSRIILFVGFVTAAAAVELRLQLLALARKRFEPYVVTASAFSDAKPFCEAFDKLDSAAKYGTSLLKGQDKSGYPRLSFGKTQKSERRPMPVRLPQLESA